MESIKEKKEAEIKEKLPEMKIKFIFLRHAIADDAKIIEKDLEECDVFCPELSNWTEEGFFTSALRKLTRNNEEADKIIEIIRSMPKDVLNAFGKELYELVYKYKKPVFMTDIPYDTSYLEKSKQSKLDSLSAENKFLDGNLIDAVKQTKSFLKEYTELQSGREAAIIGNFKNLLPKILEKYPEFCSKKEIKILSEYGTLHTKLYHSLKKEGVKTERAFPFKEYIYNYNTALLRKKRFFPDKEISDEEAAKYLVSNILFDYLEYLNRGPLQEIDEIKLNRLFAEKITLKDIEELCQGFKSGRENYESDFCAEDYLINYLIETKGLNIPRDKKELGEFIKNLR